MTTQAATRPSLLKSAIAAMLFALAAMHVAQEIRVPQVTFAQTTRNIQHVQWLCTALVSGASEVYLGGTDTTPAACTLSWAGEVLPYTVPSGRWLGITGVQIGSKFGGTTASYLVIENVLSLADTTGTSQFRTPVVVPPGNTLRMKLINNASNQQWMTAAVQGVLIDPPGFTPFTYRDVFAAVAY